MLFWDALTGSELARLSAHEEAVSKIALPSDGRLLATCGRQDMEAENGRRPSDFHGISYGFPWFFMDF